jgi:hypothetical protein
LIDWQVERHPHGDEADAVVHDKRYYSGALANSGCRRPSTDRACPALETRYRSPDLGRERALRRMSEIGTTVLASRSAAFRRPVTVSGGNPIEREFPKWNVLARGSHLRSSMSTSFICTVITFTSDCCRSTRSRCAGEYRQTGLCRVGSSSRYPGGQGSCVWCVVVDMATLLRGARVDHGRGDRRLDRP